jgi:hypothetical protein
MANCEICGNVLKFLENIVSVKGGPPDEIPNRNSLGYEWRFGGQISRGGTSR